MATELINGTDPFNAAIFMYLQPELQIESVEQAVTYYTSHSNERDFWMWSLSRLPRRFDDVVFITDNIERVNVSTLNSNIKQAMEMEGTLTDAGVYIPSIFRQAHLVGTNTFRFNVGVTSSNLFTITPSNLTIGDRIRVLRNGSDIVYATVTSIIDSYTFTFSNLVPGGIADYSARYEIQGIMVWDTERLAAINYLRGIADTPAPPSTIDSDFNPELYRMLYPDARVYDNVSAYLDYISHIENNEPRIGKVTDLNANLEANTGSMYTNIYETLTVQDTLIIDGKLRFGGQEIFYVTKDSNRTAEQCETLYQGLITEKAIKTYIDNRYIYEAEFNNVTVTGMAEFTSNVLFAGEHTNILNADIDVLNVRGSNAVFQNDVTIEGTLYTMSQVELRGVTHGVGPVIFDGPVTTCNVLLTIGQVTTAGTLTCTGNTEIQGPTFITGPTTFSNETTFEGGLKLAGTTHTTGPVICDAPLTTYNLLNTKGPLVSEGLVTFCNDVTVLGMFSIRGEVSFSNEKTTFETITNFTGATEFIGPTTVKGALDIIETVTTHGELITQGDVLHIGDVTHQGDTLFDGDVNFNGVTTWSNVANFASNTTFTGEAIHTNRVSFTSNVCLKGETCVQGPIHVYGDVTFENNKTLFDGPVTYSTASDTSFFGPVVFSNDAGTTFQGEVTFSNKVTSVSEVSFASNVEFTGSMKSIGTSEFAGTTLFTGSNVFISPALINGPLISSGGALFTGSSEFHGPVILEDRSIFSEIATFCNELVSVAKATFTSNVVLAGVTTSTGKSVFECPTFFDSLNTFGGPSFFTAPLTLCNSTTFIGPVAFSNSLATTFFTPATFSNKLVSTSLATFTSNVVLAGLTTSTGRSVFECPTFFDGNNTFGGPTFFTAPLTLCNSTTFIGPVAFSNSQATTFFSPTTFSNKLVSTSSATFTSNVVLAGVTTSTGRSVFECSTFFDGNNTFGGPTIFTAPLTLCNTTTFIGPVAFSNSQATTFFSPATFSNKLVSTSLATFTSNVVLAGVTTSTGMSVFECPTFFDGLNTFGGPTIFTAPLTLCNSTTFTGPVAFSNSLATTFFSPTTFSNELISSSHANFTGDTLLNGTTSVNGPFFFKSAPTFCNTGIFMNGIEVRGESAIHDSLFLTGPTNSFNVFTFHRTTTFNDETFFNGTTHFIGTTLFEGSNTRFTRPINFDSTLTINSNVYLAPSAEASLAGTSRVTGALDIEGTLTSVPGSVVDFKGDVVIDIGSTLEVKGEELVTGSLDIQGVATVRDTGTLNLEGTTNVKGVLDVYGETLFNKESTTLFEGVLTARGDTCLHGHTVLSNGTFDAYEAANLYGVTTFYGPIIFGNPQVIDSSGVTFIDATFSNNLRLEGVTEMNNVLILDGLTVTTSNSGVAFNGPVSFSNGATFDTEATFRKNVVFNGPVTHKEVVTFGRPIHVNDALFCNSNVCFCNNTVFAGQSVTRFQVDVSFDHQGLTTFSNTVFVPGVLKLSGSAAFEGSTSVTGRFVLAPEATVVFNDRPSFCNGMLVNEANVIALRTSNLFISESVISDGTVRVRGETNLEGHVESLDMSVSNIVVKERIDVTGTLTTTGPVSFQGETQVTETLTIVHDASLNVEGALDVSGVMHVSGPLTARDASFSGSLVSIGSFMSAGSLVSTGDARFLTVDASNVNIIDVIDIVEGAELTVHGHTALIGRVDILNGHASNLECIHLRVDNLMASSTSLVNAECSNAYIKLLAVSNLTCPDANISTLSASNATLYDAFLVRGRAQFLMTDRLSNIGTMFTAISSTDEGYIANLYGSNVHVRDLWSSNLYNESLKSSDATIDVLRVDQGTFETLSNSGTGWHANTFTMCNWVENMFGCNVWIDNLVAKVITLTNTRMNHASISNLDMVSCRGETLSNTGWAHLNHAYIDEGISEQHTISNAFIDHAIVTLFNASNAIIEDLTTTHASIFNGSVSTFCNLTVFKDGGVLMETPLRVMSTDNLVLNSTLCNTEHDGPITFRSTPTFESNVIVEGAFLGSRIGIGPYELPLDPESLLRNRNYPDVKVTNDVNLAYASSVGEKVIATDIQSVYESDVLTRIDEIEPVSFTLGDDPRRRMGVFADNIGSVFPGAVVERRGYSMQVDVMGMGSDTGASLSLPTDLIARLKEGAVLTAVQTQTMGSLLSLRVISLDHARGTVETDPAPPDGPLQITNILYEDLRFIDNSYLLTALVACVRELKRKIAALESL